MNHGNHNHKTSQQNTPYLSDKEKTEYRAEGRCFGCGELGHMVRNCPSQSIVKSGSSKPPGTSTFNIKPTAVVDAESDDHVEVLESLPLGAIFFGDNEQLALVLPWPIHEWREHYPYWNEPDIFAQRSIGDCYAMMVDSILTLEPLFPRDEQYASADLNPEL